MALDWRVYLADKSTFDSSEGKPWDVPTDVGIACILQRDHYEATSPYSIGTRVLEGQDWWLFHAYRDVPPRWNGHDLQGMIYQVMRHLNEIAVVREGVMLPHERWREILEIAQNDPDFPRKSAKRRIE